MKYKLPLLILLLSLGFSRPLHENSVLSPLLQKDDWQLIEHFDDGIRLYQRQMNNSVLLAYKVEVESQLSKEKLYSVFEQVSNYTQIIKSAKNITFGTIRNEKQTVLAYQYIDIPLLNNRYYTYELYKSQHDQDYSYWQLTENAGIDKPVNEKDIKLNDGAGLYRVIPLDGKNKVQYSLYLDPKGKIPAFLANRANRIGLVNMFRDLLIHAEKTR